MCLLGSSPQFDELIREFSEQARLAMTGAYNASPSPKGQQGSSDGQVLAEYATLLADHHRQALSPEVIDGLILELSPGEDWLSSVDSRRPHIC